MGRTGQQWIDAMGGFRIDGPSPLIEGSIEAHTKKIRKLEEMMISGKLTFDQIEEVKQQLYKLKGLPPDEWGDED
jgi:hypothetical protein